MAKVDYRRIPLEEYRRAERLFVHVFHTNGLPKKSAPLLRMLFTKSEILMFSRRIAVAEALLRGETYAAIRQKLRVGLTTIRLVDTLLEVGWPEYRRVLRVCRTMKYARRSPQEYIPVEPHTWRDLRRRYPFHFILWDLLTK
jgi:uncharacterized protein YerC